MSALKAKTTSYFLFVVTVGFFNQSVKSEDLNPRVNGELIIQIFDKQPPISLSADFSHYQLRPKELLSRRMNVWLYEYSFNNMKAADEIVLLDNIGKHSQVALAQFNHEVSQRTTLPNDPLLINQWAINNTGQDGGVPDADIDAFEAWDSTTGGMTALGDEIVIAVIDGGFDLSHADLSFFKNTADTFGNGIDDDSNGYIDDYHGWNAYNSTGNIPGDVHGTHVAGICAATGNNGIGVCGVNWNAKIMAVAGAATNEATVVRAYGYVLEMRKSYNETEGAAGAFVVATNSSFGVDLGQPANYPIWCAMYDSMGAAGILSAAATANLNIDIDIQGDIPTACGSPYMIAVTNTTHNDVKNGGAAFGATTIDLGAPGTSILSTTSGSSYGTLTGTSMASPHVAGAVALMYAAACPEFINAYHADPAAKALDVFEAILDGTDSILSLSGKTVSGGRLNIWKSIGLIRQTICGTRIAHIPLENVDDTLNDYEILCTVSSDTTFPLDSQFLYFDVGDGWVQLALDTTSQPNQYRGFIPAQSPGTIIQYYLVATDDRGISDTTETFTFKVIDYLVTLSPDVDSDSGAAYDTIQYTLSVTNSGLLIDSYQLDIEGNSWATTIWDESGSTIISTTPALLPDSTYNLKIAVAVPVATLGDQDVVQIEAISSANASIYATTVLITASTGFVCGDVNNDGSFQGILELTYLVDYIFRGGPPPLNFRPADLDGVPGFQGILELTYLVDYIFRSGLPSSCQ